MLLAPESDLRRISAGVRSAFVLITHGRDSWNADAGLKDRSSVLSSVWICPDLRERIDTHFERKQ